jgi:hypothetical protein
MNVKTSIRMGDAETFRPLLGEDAARANERIRGGLEWMSPERAPDPEGTQEQLSELCRAAAVAS